MDSVGVALKVNIRGQLLLFKYLRLVVDFLQVGQDFLSLEKVNDEHDERVAGHFLSGDDLSFFAPGFEQNAHLFAQFADLHVCSQ